MDKRFELRQLGMGVIRDTAKELTGLPMTKIDKPPHWIAPERLEQEDAQ